MNDLIDAFVRSYKRQNEFIRQLQKSFFRTCYIMDHRHEIYAEYAWTIGKAPEHLTDRDRKQAILDYILENRDEPNN